MCGKALPFLRQPKEIAARLSLAQINHNSGPVRRSLTAHQAAKPRLRYPKTQGRKSPLISRPAQNTPTKCGRPLAVINFDLSVHDHIVDANRILIRVFEGGAIDYGIWIEDRDVRK